jgi:hypothetical protein
MNVTAVTQSALQNGGLWCPGRPRRETRPRPAAGIPGRPSGALAIVVLARFPVSAQNRHADLAFIAALRGNLLYFPVFSAKTRNTPRVAARAVAQQKTRRGMPSGFLA